MNIALFPEVIVNGTVVPSAAIAGEAQNHEAPKNKPGMAWRKAARALIVRELLLQEAATRGISADPQFVGHNKRETDLESLVRAVIDECVTVPTPSDADIRAVWAQNPDRYRAPPLWEASHILCAAAPTDPDALEKAKARADAIMADIHAKPNRFARIAQDHSDCSSKSAGGMLGQLGPGDTVPEFESALRDMAEGEISATPVLTRFGYHIIRLDAVAVGAVLPFEAVAPKLKAAMEKAAWTRAVQDFTRTIIARATIVGIDLDTI